MREVFENLEVFEVDGFLGWLKCKTVICRYHPVHKFQVVESQRFQAVKACPLAQLPKEAYREVVGLRGTEEECVDLGSDVSNFVTRVCRSGMLGMNVVADTASCLIESWKSGSGESCVKLRNNSRVSLFTTRKLFGE